jgi:transcriptional regulator with XRE-family HTH domain
MRDLSLNDRVRQALSEAGLTQAELASAIRSTPDKLSKSLGGARRFTSTELARIAKTTGRSMEWLLSGAEASSPAFAGRVTGSVAQTTHVETAARFENADSSLRSLGYTHALPALPTIEKTPMFVAHGTKLAAWARQQIEASVSSSTMGLADQVEESFGVDVAQVDMPDGVHGFTWQTENFRLICLATTQNWATSSAVMPMRASWKNPKGIERTTSARRLRTASPVLSSCRRASSRMLGLPRRVTSGIAQLASLGHWE